MKLVRQINIKVLLQLFYVIAIPLMLSNIMILKSLHENQTYRILFIIAYFIRVIIVLNLILLLLKRFHQKVIVEKSARRPNLNLLLTSFLSICLLLEIIFMFIPQAQGNTKNGLAQIIWHSYYFKQINKQGYRDEELETKDTTKPKLFFLGDSFTAGNGIKKSENRFSNIIAEKRRELSIFNLGRGFSDTRDELQRLKSFPVKPNVVILQYYFNDIEETAGRVYKNNTKSNGSLIYNLASVPANSSFLLNFLAVNSTKFIPAFNTNNHRNDVKSFYNDTNIFNTHTKDLTELIQYCKTSNAKLYVLFIPDLRDISFSEENCYTKIKPLLNTEGITYITINDELKNYKANELIVGSLDAHANEMVQSIIAKKLLVSIPDLTK